MAIIINDRGAGQAPKGTPAIPLPPHAAPVVAVPIEAGVVPGPVEPPPAPGEEPTKKKG